MNIDNVKQLRDFLATLPKKYAFDHSTWHSRVWVREGDLSPVMVRDENVCGTSACIAGWAVIAADLAPYTVNAAHEVHFPTVSGPDFGTLAGGWLGLDEDQDIAALFWPFDYFDGHNDFASLHTVEEFEAFYDSRAGYSDTTVDEAIAFLDKMIEEVDVDVMWWVDIKGPAI